MAKKEKPKHALILDLERNLLCRDDISDSQAKSFGAVKRHAVGLAQEVIANVPNHVEAATIVGEIRRAALACYTSIDRRYHGKAVAQQEANAEAEDE